MSTPQVPEVRWAQRSSESEHEKNIVYLTIVTPDIVKPEISIEAKKMSVSGSDKHGKSYKLDLDLYAEIEPKETKQRNTDLNLFFVLQKKEDKADFWPRLSASKEKLHNVRTDFDKWVDEDEQDEVPELPDVGAMGGAGGSPDMASMMGGAGGMGGLDFSKLAGMGGAGGAGGQPDFAEMMKSMGGAGGMEGMGGAEDGGDSDDDEDMPALEEIKKD
ncbi:Wos2 [Taphrina deformans PYCC 5710]|uniref:Wos2 n=1 Tax=Taphrina deformans (strain PYCC 5710 / ATCC 11124 / CBS 356.35 / IMI 108563 / JCM 9778 / NBRC 8474) TaxID=1097556 RepID=R4X941_TAPDE|nr:Wos2 [Taphrina deformans PYCC 5710]|eukprot:CCG82173.1 Wos2 [Taphrina deformans PYCC 5710]